MGCVRAGSGSREEGKVTVESIILAGILRGLWDLRGTKVVEGDFKHVDVRSRNLEGIIS